MTDDRDSTGTVPFPTKLDLKVFTAADSRIEPPELIPVFHGWIQDGRLDEMLIDVADYSHVHHGPGVLLIAHDAQYHFDQGGGRDGLLYSRRRETRHVPADPEDRLRGVFRHALAACRALEEEPALAGRLSFPGDELLLRVNDRLTATTPEELERVVEPVLRPLLPELYPGAEVEVTRSGDGKEPAGLHLRASEAPGMAALLDRLGGASAGAAPPGSSGDGARAGAEIPS